MKDAVMPGVLMAHPTLNANVRETALALAEAGLLAELHTSVAVGPRLRALGSAARPLADLLERRRVPDAAAPAAVSHPAPEARRLLARRVPAAARMLGRPTLHDLYADFDAIAARRVRPGLAAVLAYEDGALDTFQAAERIGLPRIYDLPIPFWRLKHDLLEEEAERNPAWAPLLGGIDDPSWVIDRKTAELEAADLVLTASSLSTRSVRAASPATSVVQIEYGCPAPAADIRPSRGGPLKALYVGSLTQRKGLSYLFEAVSALGSRVQLTVVGSGAPAPSPVLQAALAAHRHLPSVPHQHMAALMREHDVLVLPSLVEGFGLVVTEALAQGLPVIATDRTGAVDLYGPEAEDWLVPAADSAAIAARLERWAADTDGLNDAKTTALRIAGQHTWAAYRDRVSRTVRAAIGPQRTL